MKLSSLNPQFWATGDLRFVCPKCGPPFVIIIKCHFGAPDEATAMWQWDYSGGLMDFDRLTVAPSVRNAHHGRKKVCGAHFNITAGEIQFAGD